MYFVTPYLSLGCRAEAEDVQAITEGKIQAILSLTPILRPEGVVCQLSLDVKDRATLPEGIIQEAINFIRSQIQAGRRVLVHCEMGLSRSPAIVVAYLISEHGISIEQAIDLIRITHVMAVPHQVLLASIKKYFQHTVVGAVDLSANENPLGPSPKAIAAIKSASTELHHYPDKDSTALRNKLATNLGFKSEQIFVGNGSCELIDHLTRACLSAGDEVLIPAQSFPVYCSAARIAGGTVVRTPMPDGKYCVESILEKVTSRTKLVIVGSPNNPTGTILVEKQLESLINGLPESVWLLVDEAYRDYVDDTELADALSWVAKGKNVIVMRTLSKAHGLAGLRIGYGIAPLPIAEAMGRLRQNYNTNMVAQLAAVAALDDQEHLALTYANNNTELARVQCCLSEMGVDFIPSRANFVLIRASQDYVGRLALAGVRVKEMARFGAPDHFRVSIGLPHENTKFLEAFAEVLAESREVIQLAVA